MNYEDLRNPMYGRMGAGYDRLNIEKEIEKLFEFFPTYKNKATIQRWAERLAGKSITPKEVARAAEHVVSTQNKICAISELESIIYNQSPRFNEVDREKEEKFDREASELRGRTKQYLDMALETYSQEQIDSLLLKWWEGIYGGDPKEYGLSLRVFYPIFFQDLEAAGWNLDKAIVDNRISQ